MSTSVSNLSSPPRVPRKRRSSRTLVIVCALLVTLLVATVVAIKGAVSGTEFSPTHFQTRDYSYYEIPFLHLQITPVSRINTTGPVASQLRTSSWISAPRGQKAIEWHQVSVSRGPSTTPLVASLLNDTLNLSRNGNPFWVDWNKNHPQRASVVWPVVQKLAKRELYILIPELLEIARSLPGKDLAQPLSHEIDAWLVDQYVVLVRDMRDAGRTDLADELLAESMTDYPDSRELAALQ